MPKKSRIHTSIAYFLTIALLLFANTLSADELVSVNVPSADDIQRLFSLGVDVWEVKDGQAVVLTKPKDLQRLRDDGFELSVLCKNRDEIYRLLRVNTDRMLAPDAAAFHTYAELTSALNQIASNHPEICRLFSIGQSIQGRELWMLKISDNPATDEPEPEVLFIGCQHAREWIAEEVPLGLADYFTENYTSDSTVRQAVDQAEIFIFPLANPDGKEYTHTTDRMWRKNRRDNGDGTFGIDLNRNLPYKFHYGVDTASIVYGGPAPISEPETQHLVDFITSRSITALINYHSFGQIVIHPWAYTYNSPLDEAFLDGLTQRVCSAINSVGLETYTAGQWSDLLNYLGYGVTGDWVYAEQGIPYVGVELRSKSASPGFLLDESQIAPTIQENIPGALELIKWAQEQFYDPTPPLIISDITIHEQAANRLIVTWETDDYADGVVEFGPTPQLGFCSIPSAIRGKKHLAKIVGIIPGKEYFLRCVSNNLAGFKISSDLVANCITSSADGIIIDNLDPQFSSTGWWNPSTNVPGYFDQDYAYASSSWAMATAEWCSELPCPGSYTVYIRYSSASDRAPDTPYTVFHEGGDETFYVDQRTGGGTWLQLGTFLFSNNGERAAEGEPCQRRVVLTNSAATGIVIADAVRFQYVPATDSVKFWSIY